MRKTQGVVLSALCSILGAAGMAQAQQGTLFYDTFEESTMRPQWSVGSRLETWTPIFSGFNGRYSNGHTTLTLTQPDVGLNPIGVTGVPGGGGGGGGGGGDPPPPEGRWIEYTLRFDFFCLDSWDGSNTVYGRDWFHVLTNNTVGFRETFANQTGAIQTFREPNVGRSQLGYHDVFLDSIYRNVGFNFTVPLNQPLVITWADEGLQGLNDESWGIDNVRVEYRVVPAPGALALFGGAASLALRRRRR